MRANLSNAAIPLFGLACLLATTTAAWAEPPRLEDHGRFTIEVEGFVLTDAPVRRVVISAIDDDGGIDTDFEKKVDIRGIRMSQRKAIGPNSARIGVDDDVALPAFRNGVLDLRTDLAAGRKIYIDASRIVVDPDGPRPETREVSRTLRWFSLVPPLLAVILAVWLRNVLIALFAAVWSGAVILDHGDFFAGFLHTVDTYIVGEIVALSDGRPEHAMIILFTMFLGAMVGLMSASGGTHALVDSLARFTRKREHGQLMTWALGLVVFFDDYANTLLLGSTMRPITDRLKISREKLAFLVDSTAAPIAGLALISTWVGYEVGLIGDAYEQVFRGSGTEWDAYSIFLATIPYRFYPLFLLVFVWLIAYTGHDFGPMHRAESEALRAPDAEHPATDSEFASPERPRRLLLRNALIPLITLLALLMIGLWTTGIDGLPAANARHVAANIPPVKSSLWSVIGSADSYRVLLISSFIASLTAVASAASSRALTLGESLEAWSDGAKSMFAPIMILVLAWGVGTVCNGDHLDTAGVLIELTRGMLSPQWMPAIAFLLAAVVSFATGSSFSTMGILMPLLIPMTFYLLVDANQAEPTHQLLLATIGAVLAGSIFGDHCSPISDTTVLSSAASGCDHLRHVTTQMPYAIAVAVVSLLLGYIPAGFGYHPILMSCAALFVLYLLVQFLGRPAGEETTPASVQAPADDAGLDDFADLDV